ncbi:NAD-dependent epimerase/dehydratase family protein [Desulfosarcina sp. OttesenSCG-928-A07]|nr:NAD-dependent epimerase/dehydratase family protein [Desulfosarcina sp. OttesenSCG-928-A07]
MKYLITGATGFMGPHLLNQLSAAGHSCRCLVRQGSEHKIFRFNTTEILSGDLTDPGSLTGAADGVDCLFHLATLGHMNNFAVSPDLFRAVNVHGTLNIMEEALRAGVKHIVHCSSVAAMGICKETPADETTPCHPHHAYGKSKLEAEQAVLRLVKAKGLPASIVRFSMIYGPGDPRDMLKLTRMAKKHLFPKIGNRPKLTPLIHVQDAVKGLLLAAEKGKPGEIYLITNPQSEPFDKIREIIQEALGIRKMAVYVPEGAALKLASAIEWVFKKRGKNPPVSRKNIESILADRSFSIAKAMRELGFMPTVDPASGIHETVKWYTRHKWV